MELTLLQPVLNQPAIPLTKMRWRAAAWVLAPIPGLVVSFSTSAICYWQTNVTVGLFLGPLLLATLYAPCLILAENRASYRLSVLAAMTIGPAILWLLVSASSHLITFHQVLLCVLVLAGWLTLVCGVSLVLSDCQLVASLASSVTVMLSFIWLTWPIWLSPLLASHERIVGWLCWAHPIMAMNSSVRHLGLWGSPMGGSDLAYRYLTILNQDVAYPHSQSVWPCVILHILVGLPLLSASILVCCLRSYRTSTVSG